jgi:hypothetical protein
MIEKKWKEEEEETKDKSKQKKETRENKKKRKKVLANKCCGQKAQRKKVYRLYDFEWFALLFSTSLHQSYYSIPHFSPLSVLSSFLISFKELLLLYFLFYLQKS